LHLDWEEKREVKGLSFIRAVRSRQKQGKGGVLAPAAAWRGGQVPGRRRCREEKTGGDLLKEVKEEGRPAPRLQFYQGYIPIITQGRKVVVGG